MNIGARREGRTWGMGGAAERAVAAKNSSVISFQTCSTGENRQFKVPKSISGIHSGTGINRTGTVAELPRNPVELMARHYEDDIVDFTGETTRRLRPPARYQGRIRSIFVAVVSACDPRHFRPADLPLLERFCEATALAEQAAEKLAIEGPVVDGRLSAWFLVHQSASKMASGLALRLRLGPQSRAPRAPKTIPQTPSFYETLELEANNDDDAEPH